MHWLNYQTVMHKEKDYKLTVEPQCTQPQTISRHWPTDDSFTSVLPFSLEETIAIKRDWVYNKACRLSHNIDNHITLDYIILNDPFELIIKRTLSIFLNL